MRCLQLADPPITGRIAEILQDSMNSDAFIVLDIYHTSSERHHVFGMPVLARRFGEKSMRVVTAKARHFYATSPLLH